MRPSRQAGIRGTPLFIEERARMAHTYWFKYTLRIRQPNGLDFSTARSTSTSATPPILDAGEITPELTIEFFDKVLDGTITNEEFARYLPTLERMGVLKDLMPENDNL